jgi:hypothetical protein
VNIRKQVAQKSISYDVMSLPFVEELEPGGIAQCILQTDKGQNVNIRKQVAVLLPRNIIFDTDTHFCYRLCKPQDFVNKKNYISHRVSNLRPSGLKHTALTTTPPRRHNTMNRKKM